MGWEDHLSAGFLLTTVENIARYVRAHSVWPATFGLACCSMELFSTFGPRHDLARFGMERAASTPRRAIRLPQPPADAIKRATKEDIVPRRAGRVLFWLAPAVATIRAWRSARNSPPPYIVRGLIVVASRLPQDRPVATRRRRTPAGQQNAHLLPPATCPS